MYPEDDITETIGILEAVEHDLQNSDAPDIQDCLIHLRAAITSLERYRDNVPQYQIGGQRVSVLTRIYHWLHPQN